MKTKLLIVAGLALAIATSLARAQEEWGERPWEYMHELREGCENGDESACERLRHIRELRMDCQRGDEEDCERLEHMLHEWREHRRQYERESQLDRGEAPPPVDPKAALCFTIETNYNNCIKQRAASGCVAWVVELKANHCF